MPRKHITLFGLILFIFLSFTAYCQEKNLDVPYLPTPMPVVEEMLRIAAIEPGDILYDLGCGDGRILNTAARLYGIRGVGVDLDSERIQESRENAKAAGVENKVEFHQKDLFETDIQGATVMTLYLLPSVNIRLRPKLLRELKPGTRIISHDFDMDEWLADKSIQVWADDEMHMLYYWVIPNNVSGIWDSALLLAERETQPVQVQFQQVFQFPQGHALIEGDKIELHNVTLTGNTLSFSLHYSGVTWDFEGHVSGNRIKGTARKSGTDDTVSWSAERRPDTKRSLDPNSVDEIMY
jgi:ubiquinone/menaquinone biosynthesis C-methylase UbiE